MKVHSMLALEAVEEPHWCNAHVWVSKTAGHGYSLRVFSKNLKFYIVPKLYMTKLPVSCYTGFTKTKNTKNCPDYLVKSTTFLCFSDFFFSGLGICPQIWDWLNLVRTMKPKTKVKKQLVRSSPRGERERANVHFSRSLHPQKIIINFSQDNPQTCKEQNKVTE